MTFRRVTAYDPLTAEPLDRLPDYTKLHTVRNLYGLSTGQIIYPSAGRNRTLLNDPVMLKVERVLGTGLGEEHWNSRYLLAGTPDNDEYTDGAYRTYNLVGVRWWLSTVPILTPSASLEPDGTPVKPMRRWTNKNPGQILGDIFNEVQALGFLPGMTKDWGFVNDSAGVPWDAVLDNIPYLEWPIEAPFESLVSEIEVRMGLVEIAFNGMEWRMFRARTHMYRDLTIGNAPVAFRWGQDTGIEKATEALDYLSTVTEALVIGADGKPFDPHNFGSDGHAYYGKVMHGLNVPWAHNADMAKQGAESMFRSGARERKEITLEIDKGVSRVEPDADFRLGDRVFVQKGQNPTDADGASNTGEQRITVIEETDGEKSTMSVTFADKMHRLEVLTAQRAARLTAGADVSSAGASRAPGVDEREPTAPLTFTVTPSNYTDASGIQRAGFVAAWTDDGDAVPDPITGQVAPLDRGGYELQYQSSETANDWQTYRIFKPTATGGTIKGLSATATGYKFRLRTRSYTDIGKSAWLEYPSSGSVAIPADVDVRTKAPGLVYDAAFQNADVRAKRTADSGSAGLTWPVVSGGYVAQIADTTAVLKSGTAGELTSGRVAVQGSEKYLVGGTGKRVGGSAATIQFGVRSWNKAGTATLVANVAVISGAGTSDTTVTAVYTMPSDSVEAEWRVRMTSPSGGAVIQVHTPIFDRQANPGRIEDEAVITAKVGPLAITEPKNANDAVSTRVVAALAVTNPKVANAAIDNPKVAPDAIDTPELANGAHLDGTVNTGGIGLGDAASSVLTLNSSGDIVASGAGLVTYDATSHQLEGNGQLDGAWTHTGSFGPVSSRRHKVDIEPTTLEQAEALLSLQPFRFRYDPAWQKEAKAVYMLVGPAEGAPPGTRTRKRLGHIDRDTHVGLASEDVEQTGKLDEMLLKKDEQTVGLEIQSGWLYLIPMINQMREEREQDRAEIAELRRRLGDGPGDR